MPSCQCQAVEELFSQEYVAKELNQYRAKGPDKTTRMLTEAIKGTGLGGSTLLDIGGGVGAVQHALLSAGVQAVTSVEASSAYLNAARMEAQRRGLADRVRYHYGSFVDLAPEIPQADIVTLDRVICCYDDMENLVRLSAERARRVYGVVYPRDIWLAKAGNAMENLYYRLTKNPFRSFVHPTRAVEAILKEFGLRRQTYLLTPFWQVAVYIRQPFPAR